MAKIKPKPPGKELDAVTTLGDQKIYVYETEGGPFRRYKDQHDAVAVGTARSATPDSLRKMFQKVSDNVRRRRVFKYDGCTAAIAHLSTDDTLLTAHLGDSRVTLFVESHATGTMTAHQLTKDHDAKNASERRRVLSMEGGFIDKYNYFMNGNKKHLGSIQISRAFGCRILAPYITDEPEISTYRLSGFAGPQDRVFLCIDCDGAREWTGPAARGKILREWDKASSQNPARLLAEKAVADGSTDNVSVILAELSPFRHKNLMLAVFDGFGDKGNKASQHVAKLVKKQMTYAAKL